jgi:hypothetical protein
MFFRLVILLLLLLVFCPQSYSEQKINDFYLCSYDSAGSQEWLIEGDRALLYDNYTDIFKVKAMFHSHDGDALVFSDVGRIKNPVHNAVLTGHVKVIGKQASIFTKRLYWREASREALSNTWVLVKSPKASIKAFGMFAVADSRKAYFFKKVRARMINPGQDTVEVTCQGLLVIDYFCGKAVFNKHVVMTSKDGRVSSDKATEFFDPHSRKLVKIISQGNVRVQRGVSVSYSEHAKYDARDSKVTFTGKPKVIYFPEKKS